MPSASDGLVPRCATGQRRPIVALLCPEARLRRILQLALRADGFDVLEWSDARLPLPVLVVAVIADLDSLRWRPERALAALRTGGLDPATALVLISIYPPEQEALQTAGRLAYLQPPFAPTELTERLAGLLEQAVAKPAEPGAGLARGPESGAWAAE